MLMTVLFVWVVAIPISVVLGAICLAWWRERMGGRLLAARYPGDRPGTWILAPFDRSGTRAGSSPAKRTR